MSNFSIAQRYSKALFQTAQQKNNLEQVYSDLCELMDIYKSNDALRDVFRNPLLTDQQQIKILKAILENKVEGILLEFLCFLASKGRLNLFAFVYESFQEFWDEFKGQIRVKVQTASPIDGQNQASLLEKLKTITHKNILPEWQVDPGMIGGIRVYAQGRLYEHSFKNEFQDFKRKALERV